LLDVLRQSVGAGTAPCDVSLDALVGRVPLSRWRSSGPFTLAAETRIRHARGQSFADLVAMRSGRLDVVPDAVAYPRCSADLRSVVGMAGDRQAVLIPFGGGTSVVGGVTAPSSEVPVLTVDLCNLDGLLALDRRAGLATFGAGTCGPQVEAVLRAQGLTLGHFPQSFELSTVGGWVATRSSGQQSMGFGRIEDLFAGGVVEAPAGTLVLPPFPASAAGPDLRQLVLGSEGRLGIITEATVRVRPVSDVDVVHAVFLPAWETAVEATRELVRSGTALSMLRLSSPEETETNLALARESRTADLLQKALAVRHVDVGKCLLLVGIMGTTRQTRQQWRAAHAVVGRYGGVHVGQALGRTWQRGRFRQPYLRNTLWEQGYGVDTVETATTWSRLPRLLENVERDLRNALAAVNERVHAITHLSHVYPTGSSVYTTFVFRLGGNADETLHRWQLCKDAASRAIVANGGTISHQHGVGIDHRRYLPQEKGPLGIEVLRSVARTLDPDNLMNPGKLL